MNFTIFTPTFNRKKFLPLIYQSLLDQQRTDFEWLIVDDGSTDGTDEVVQELISRGEMVIRYFVKENGGKHTAINVGVAKANYELFIIIDSDDVFAKGALEAIAKQWMQVKDNNLICGIVGLSSFTDGKIVGTRFLEENWDISFSDIYHKYNLTGDKSVAFKTSVLKQFPFPEQQDIRFVFEAVVWHEMAKKYKVRCINTVTQIVEYQTQGLSDSSYKKWYLQAMAYSYYHLIRNNTHSILKYPKVFIWNYIYLMMYSLLAEENYVSKLRLLSQKVLCWIVFPRAYYSYLNMRKLIVN